MLDVRRVRPDDWERWRALRLRALAESPRAFGSTYVRDARLAEEVWQERTRAFAAPAADRAMFVAVDVTGDWVGCAGAIVDGRAPDLISMWVAPEHRGRGAGRALVEAVIDWVRAAGHRQLRLDVVRGQDAALRLYGRLGFRPTGQATPLPRDPSLIEEGMVLNLE